MRIELPIKNRDKSYSINPTKIIALGLNYFEHIRESAQIAHKVNPEKYKLDDFTVPPEPYLFPKTPNVLIGPEQSIILPKMVDRYDFSEPRTDIEAELAIIIKDKCKNVTPEEAISHILGFTCMNDVSQRNIQKGDKTGWFRGKSFDTFGPIGPQIVLVEDLPNFQTLHIESRVNGNICQSSNTKLMIFKVEDIIAFISQNFTLEAGDIISTGTPKGVHPIYPGDMVEVEIEEIGILRNSVEIEK